MELSRKKSERTQYFQMSRYDRLVSSVTDPFIKKCLVEDFSKSHGAIDPLVP